MMQINNLNINEETTSKSKLEDRILYRISNNIYFIKYGKEYEIYSGKEKDLVCIWSGESYGFTDEQKIIQNDTEKSNKKTKIKIKNNINQEQQYETSDTPIETITRLYIYDPKKEKILSLTVEHIKPETAYMIQEGHKRPKRITLYNIPNNKSA